LKHLGRPKLNVRRLARGVKETVRWGFSGGYRRSSRIHYSASPYPIREYLPDSSLMKLNGINGELSNRVLKDKVLFRYFLGSYFRIPEILAFVEKGELYVHPESGKVRDLRTLCEFCEGSRGVILKQSDGRAGMGVLSLEVGPQGWLLNNRPVSEGEVAARLGRLDNYIVTERVSQADYAAAVFPHAANSLRVVTMQDLDRGNEPFIAVAYQKFGSLASVPTDNWSAGGFRSEIDLQTGELKPAIKKYLKRKSEHVFYDEHPETGGQIAGVRVPDWPSLKAELLGVLDELRFLRLVGWDVLVQNDGFCVLEGNTRPSLISLQATSPILRDPRAKKFFEHYKIVG